MRTRSLLSLAPKDLFPHHNPTNPLAGSAVIQINKVALPVKGLPGRYIEIIGVKGPRVEVGRIGAGKREGCS